MFCLYVNAETRKTVFHSLHDCKLIMLENVTWINMSRLCSSKLLLVNNASQLLQRGYFFQIRYFGKTVNWGKLYYSYYYPIQLYNLIYNNSLSALLTNKSKNFSFKYKHTLLHISFTSKIEKNISFFCHIFIIHLCRIYQK